ncbi:MAG: hypothetical protein HC851_20490 [Acaryochloris sp. RU_4_1]|nr:hypothetical protein [Acaryochloris sp. RU_4_1]
MSAWLTDGVPMPESGQSKCDRVKAARQSAGLDTESVKRLLESQFQRTSPSQLATEQVDELIQMIEATQPNAENPPTHADKVAATSATT